MNYVIHLDAGREINGNPKRGFMVFDKAGKFIETIDEGYQGRGVLSKKYPDALVLSTVPTNKSFLKGALRLI